MHCTPMDAFGSQWHDKRPVLYCRDSGVHPPWCFGTPLGGWYDPSATRSVSVRLGSVSVAMAFNIATASFVLRVADGFSRTIRDSASSRAYPGTPTRLRAHGAHRPHCAVSASCSEEFPLKLEHSQKRKVTTGVRRNSDAGKECVPSATHPNAPLSTPPGIHVRHACVHACMHAFPNGPWSV